MPAPGFARLVCLAALGAGLVARPGDSRGDTVDAKVPPHRIDIDVRGPLALVTVERPLSFGPELGRAPSDELVVDLDLPDGSRLVDAQVRHPKGTLELRAIARPTYAAALETAGWRRSKIPVDEGADLRLQVAAADLGRGQSGVGFTLRYRFVAPLGCRDGALMLAMPASLDPAPAPAQVVLRASTGSAAPIAGLTVGAAVKEVGGAAGASLRSTVATAAPWEVLVTLGHSMRRARSASARPAFALSAAGPVNAGKRLLAVAMCRPAVAGRTAAAPPGRLLLLLDRSRSVGPQGASVSRELARAIVEALPPSVQFNVVLFDRAAEPLFKLARAPTLEALGELDTAAGLGSLRNGTRPVPALRQAAELDSRDRTVSPRYWILITDGALPEDQTPEALQAAVRSVPRDAVEAAVVVLREAEEERPSPAAERALAAVPGHLGGILRQLPTRGVKDAAPGLIEALRRGGDLIDPRVTEPASLRTATFDRAAVAPGDGARLIGRASDGGGRVTVRAVSGGNPIVVSAASVAIGGDWAAALDGAPPAAGWQALGEGAAAQLVPGPAALAAASSVRGQMDRDVVHKALGYAYLPRARACYLTRAVKTSSDFQLRGRLRLELHLERGEMMDAVVKRSTLGRPDIEACLREAAYSLEVPRAMLNDAPVIAALNLVFRPRTDPAKPDASAGSGDLSSQIDRILGPLPTGSDPLELLIEGP